MAVGCLLAGLVGNTYWAVLGLSVATIGLYASQAHLFPLPAVFLTGPALASGIAWVNSVGILGGSASPPIVGWFKDATGSFSGGLYALAIFVRRPHLCHLRARDARSGHATSTRSGRRLAKSAKRADHRAHCLTIGDVADHQPRQKWPAHRSVHKDPAWVWNANALLLK
jgi:hypothetical protein